MSSTPYPLGRIHQPDDRDQGYLMAEALPRQPLPTKMLWTAGPVQDQGQTPACVGYSWSDWMRCLPLATMNGPAGLDIYHQAQLIDGMKMPHDGSTVRAGAQVMQKEGRVARYVWAWDAETVVKWVLTTGPVVVGTNWLNDMFTPDANGLLSVSGAVAGGHAYSIIGADTSTGLVQMLNHWGVNWARGGMAFMRIPDLDVLLKNSGEACAAVEEKPSSEDQPESKVTPR